MRPQGHVSLRDVAIPTIRTVGPTETSEGRASTMTPSRSLFSWHRASLYNREHRQHILSGSWGKAAGHFISDYNILVTDREGST